MIPISVVALIVIVGYFLLRPKQQSKPSWIEPSTPFLEEWREILTRKVAFYNALSVEEKEYFEFEIQEFLLNCRITGIRTDIDITDKLLVAASAVIPIFKFRDWKYLNIHEILLYPALFNEQFETEGGERQIAGMIGNGYMEGKMILSKPALIHGFENESDKKNTAIHEFVHLIDKADGSIDGVPKLLLEKQYVIPWIDLISKKMDEIYEGNSDINPYGASHRAEFFAVVSEYFFERPKLLAKKHPELYGLLEKIFKQQMDTKNLSTIQLRISRNSPCPCNSGLKFKNCCGRIHYEKIS
jgi:MtfA peptidase